MQYIYLHGLGQSACAWDGVLSSTKVGHPASSPDLVGLLAGRPPTYENLYRRFRQYCAGFPGPLGLCGLSLGAVLALNYAAERPQRVKGLVLAGAQYKMPRLLLKLQSAVFKVMRESAFRQLGFDKRGVIQLSRSMEALDFSGELKSIACPTLVLCGERDRANQRAARELAARLPHARLGMVAGAGHEVNLEAPRQVAAALEGYIKELGTL